MSHPGAQAYLDSVFQLLAGWGVDFVKVDDIAAPTYRQSEVDGYRLAIQRSGRPMVLSLSPGPTPLASGAHVAANAHMWRIVNDLWDNWPALDALFDQLRDWTPYRTTGAWPDPDMIPIGRLSKQGPVGSPRYSGLTAGRAAHPDDAVVDHPVAADVGRQPDREPRRRAGADDQRRGARGRPEQRQQPSALRRYPAGVGGRRARAPTTGTSPCSTGTAAAGQRVGQPGRPGHRLGHRDRPVVRAPTSARSAAPSPGRSPAHGAGLYRLAPQTTVPVRRPYTLTARHSGKLADVFNALHRGRGQRRAVGGQRADQPAVAVPATSAAATSPW